MGFRCRWIAVRGRDRDDVLARLKCVVTTQHDEAVYDTGLYALDVNGWVFVIGDGWDYMDLVKREQASLLSNRGEALFFYTDDSAMAAELTAFAAGQQTWSIVYDGSQDERVPRLDGDVPTAVKTALAAARKEQAAATGDDADVDHIYDVPPTVALELTGFRHDQTLSSGERLPIYQLELLRA